MKKTLFIVDAQKDFLLNDGKLNLGHDTSEFRKKLASFIRSFDGHIVLTQDTHDKQSCEFKSFPEHCLMESDGWKIVDEVTEAVNENTNTHETIFKRTYSGTSLYWTLSERVLLGEIHVVGVCTHICVHDLVSSIVNFAKDKYNIIPLIIVHKDLVDDFNSEMAEMALIRLQSLYDVQII